MYINDNSINSLVEGLTDRDKLVVKIFNSTACKTNELIELKLENISKNQILINDRIIPISENLYNQIQTYALKSKLNSENYLFSSRQSEKITAKRIRQIIQNSSKETLGFKINPKDLRKASICEKIKKEDLEEVKKQVGLKRFDKRVYLSQFEITKINSSIKDVRTKVIFSLLISGLKSINLTKIKVNEISTLKIKDSIRKEIKRYIQKNKLSNNDPLFLTRQKSSLTKERIFQIISSLKEKTGINVSPRILNNTALANAVVNSDENKLNEIGVKHHSFHLHGGFIKNE